MQKYQIFVSSTYEDLRIERETVVRAVLEMGHIPVGMEMFSAADEEQWRIIQRHIDESDYYIAILAHRYGSTLEDGQSYTRREYEYAVTRGVPVLAFLIDEKAEWPADRVDKDPIALAGLEDFKARVKERLVDFWRNSDELHAKCVVALMKAFTAYPREGWVRASTSVASPAVMAELTRLSAENAALRQQLDDAKRQSRADEKRRVFDVRRALESNTVQYNFRRRPSQPWEDSPETSLFDIFYWLAPSLVTEDSTTSLSQTLAMHAAINSPWDLTAMNQVRAILADLVALGLVEPSARRHSVNDDNDYWTLASLGRELLKEVRQLSLHAEPLPEAEDVAQKGDEETSKGPGSL
ncbi:MAG TPA: DUF4062 domain-containing protein [Acidimicrobiales bacterium]|jgi:hypothetical protein